MSMSLAPLAEGGCEDATFTIAGLTWSQYVAINDALDNPSNLRTLYLDGSLTFLSPSRKHEWSEDGIDSIIKAIAVGCGINLDIVGSATLRKDPADAGIEGDRCYYLRENAERMGGAREINLETDPPPDLAVEIDHSNHADKAMAIYARLGVPEVWRLDVRRRQLGFWKLGSDGRYAAVAASPGFPFLTPADVRLQFSRAEAIKSYTRWSLELHAWVRDVVRPRLDAR